MGVALLRAERRRLRARGQLRHAEVGRELRADEHREPLRPDHQPARRRPAPTSTGSSTGGRRCATGTRSTATPPARSTTRDAVGTLRSTAKVARALGKPEDAAATRLGGRTRPRTSTQAAPFRRPLHATACRSAAGNPRSRTPRSTPDYPVYYGVARRPTARRWGQHRRPGHETGPDDLARAAEGADRLGRYDQVVKLMTDENADGRPARWPSRARSCGSSGTRAATSWPCVPTNNESMSHGWGAWGIVDMIESLLGIEVTSPGAATVRIEPPAVDTADLHRVSAARPGRSAARSRVAPSSPHRRRASTRRAPALTGSEHDASARVSRSLAVASTRTCPGQRDVRRLPRAGVNDQVTIAVQARAIGADGPGRTGPTPT